ncbi:MAG: hypothetical protein B7Z37_28335 [Verrucomicrobia bacterium 12-59-8]|nr:MAG: hypothetical protein B7Z37_28335 [Verrucomicrobia bacterium 12-59-8]
MVADATVGGATSTAVDNLICWSPNGSSFRIFTQDLEPVNGTHEAIDLRFVAIPYAPVSTLPQVTLAAADASAGEHGADQALLFTITRSGDPAAALAVPLIASGTATAGADYSGFVSSVTIPAGSTSTTLPLTVLSDNLAEGDESVILSLGSSVEFTPGTPASAQATIADQPAQSWYASNIPDPAKRGPADDADNDGVPNLIEYFTGTQPADGGSRAPFTAQVTGGSVVFRFNRALNAPDVTGVVEWSRNLQQWYRSGQSDGVLSLNITEGTSSAPSDNPQVIDATATTTAGPLPEGLFFRLNVTH